MILWIIAIALTIIFVFLLLLVFLRKLQYDSIHQNLLDLEDAYGGKVMRGGFAVRPRYSGLYKGKRISVSITTSKDKRGRIYHIEVTMQASSKFQFSVMNAQLIKDQNIQPDRKERMKSISSDKYVFEVIEKDHLSHLNLKRLGDIILQMDPFEFILISKNQLMLERVSHDFRKDTDIRYLGNLIKSMYEFRDALEKV